MKETAEAEEAAVRRLATNGRDMVDLGDADSFDASSHKSLGGAGGAEGEADVDGNNDFTAFLRSSKKKQTTRLRAQPPESSKLAPVERSCLSRTAIETFGLKPIKWHWRPFAVPLKHKQVLVRNAKPLIKALMMAMKPTHHPGLWPTSGGTFDKDAEGKVCAIYKGLTVSRTSWDGSARTFEEFQAAKADAEQKAKELCNKLDQSGRARFD